MKSVRPADPLPAPVPRGLTRSAQLMLALGPRARILWERLNASETHALNAEMGRLSGEAHHPDPRAAEAFLAETEREPAPSGDPLAGPASVWSRLSALETPALIAVLGEEPAPVLAAIAARLEAPAAARLIAALGSQRAVELLLRLLRVATPAASVMALIEAELESRLARAPAAADAQARLAGILDRLGGEEAEPLLSALAVREPEAAERVRALMFTFEDLAHLDAAGVQTLLSRLDRGVLALALKGATDALRRVFLSNMTARAQALLGEEMAALGPVRRSEIERARAVIMEEVRLLIDRGDLMVGRNNNPDDLVE